MSHGHRVDRTRPRLLELEVGVEGAVDKGAVGGLELGERARVERLGPRRIHQARAAAGVGDPHAEGRLRGVLHPPVEPVGNLAREREETCFEGAVAVERQGFVQGEGAPGRVQDLEDDVVVEHCLADPGSGDDPVGQRFAQHQKTQRVVDVGVGQQDGVEGDVTGSGPRMEPLEVGELVADVRASVDHGPSLAVGGHRHGGLVARRHIRVSAAGADAVLAAAIPLRKPAPRR